MPTEKTDIKQRLDREIMSIVKRFRIDKKYWSKEDLSYTYFLSNKMLIIAVIREGIPFSFFNLIRHLAPFSEQDWADFLDMSTKSLTRYRQTARQFKPIQSEKIIEMAEVTHEGLEVFGDPDKFRLWLETPNFSLGNLKPIELLKDSYGKEMVMGELVRINHGILA